MNASDKSMVAVQGMTAGYGRHAILREVSFDVRRGEVCVILGGSGCGKSTLLKHMIGLHPPLAGRVLIDGEDFTAAAGADRLRLMRRFGVTYQHGALFGSLTLLENVRLALEEFTALPADALELTARLKLALVGLLPAANRLPSEISGGMQKRAAIARALALDPDILFLDEPSAGLDPVASAELDALVLNLVQALGTTFVVVTHELPSIYAIADQAVFLDQEAQGVLAVGRPADLRDHCPHARVRDFFTRTPSLVPAGGRLARKEGVR